MVYRSSEWDSFRIFVFLHNLFGKLLLLCFPLSLYEAKCYVIYYTKGIEISCQSSRLKYMNRVLSDALNIYKDK